MLDEFLYNGQSITSGHTLGTGLFIGTGTALAEAGPANLLIGFSITGIVLMFTMHSLGELAVSLLYPLPYGGAPVC